MSKFLHADDDNNDADNNNDDAKAISMPRAFSENSRAKMSTYWLSKLKLEIKKKLGLTKLLLLIEQGFYTGTLC